VTVPLCPIESGGQANCPVDEGEYLSVERPFADGAAQTQRCNVDQQVSGRLFRINAVLRHASGEQISDHVSDGEVVVGAASGVTDLLSGSPNGGCARPDGHDSARCVAAGLVRFGYLS
jgi:hypothetical protein